MYRYGVVFGVNSRLHDSPFCCDRSARLPKMGATVTSLGREASQYCKGIGEIYKITENQDRLWIGNDRRSLVRISAFCARIVNRSGDVKILVSGDHCGVNVQGCRVQRRVYLRVGSTGDEPTIDIEARNGARTRIPVKSYRVLN